MEWFNRVVLGEIRQMMQAARVNYCVDPVIFIVIYLFSVPFFYYSIFRMVRALARKRGNEIMVWSIVFLAATAAPFLYVLFFGRNLPWWVYVVIALLIGQGVYSLVRRLTKKPAADAAASAESSDVKKKASPEDHKGTA
jgi:fatty acid desaturase